MEDYIENLLRVHNSLHDPRNLRPRTPEDRSEEALDSLLRQLCSRRQEVWGVGMMRLIHFGPTAIEPLVRLITHGENDVRDRASFVLKMMADVRSLTLLAPLLRDEDAYVADEALRILRKIGSEDGNHLARKILSQPDLNAGERLRLLHLLEQVVPRDWNTKLRFPFGSLHLFCRQMARSDDADLRAGAISVLDCMALPRASQRHTLARPREMLRPALGASQPASQNLLRSVASSAQIHDAPPQS